jgi:hypothetical protein
MIAAIALARPPLGHGAGDDVAPLSGEERTLSGRINQTDL